MIKKNNNNISIWKWETACVTVKMMTIINLIRFNHYQTTTISVIGDEKLLTFSLRLSSLLQTTYPASKLYPRHFSSALAHCWLPSFIVICRPIGPNTGWINLDKDNRHTLHQDDKKIWNYYTFLFWSFLRVARRFLLRIVWFSESPRWKRTRTGRAILTGDAASLGSGCSPQDHNDSTTG